MPSDAVDASAVLDTLRQIWRSIGVTPEEEAQRVASLVTDAEAERDAQTTSVACGERDVLERTTQKNRNDKERNRVQ